MKTVNAATDLGYGWGKAVANGILWRQPSVLGDARQLFEENIRPTDITYDGQYFVGEKAIRHSDIRYASIKEDKAATWTTEILLRTALGMVAPHDTVNLVTGLPVDFFFSQKKQMEELLGGFQLHSYRLTVGWEERVCCPYIGKFKVVPQPLGGAMDYLLDDTGKFTDETKSAAKKRLLIIDVGYYTLDLLILDAMEIGKASCSPPGLGIDTAYRLLQKELKERLGKVPARYELDHYILAGTYEGLDIKPLVDIAFKALAAQVQLEVDSLNMHFEKVILVGGAAEQIKGNLDIENLVTLPDPQAANVRGYLKIASRLWGL